MRVNVNDVIEEIEGGFANRYSHFKEFQSKTEYHPYWSKCIEAVADRDLLVSIIFCNDIFTIPPVKTFLTYYRDEFIFITGDKRAKLDIFVKRGIGAFWGMVFKFALGYTEQKSVSVSMNEYFIVKTASVYFGVAKPIKIEQTEVNV